MAENDGAGAREPRRSVVAAGWRQNDDRREEIIAVCCDFFASAPPRSDITWAAKTARGSPAPTAASAALASGAADAMSDDGRTRARM